MTWGSTRRWGNCSTRNPTATFGAVRVARAHVVVVVAAITHDAKSAKVRCERAFEVQHEKLCIHDLETREWSVRHGHDATVHAYDALHRCQKWGIGGCCMVVWVLSGAAECDLVCLWTLAVSA
jgi:hypothetical protein